MGKKRGFEKEEQKEYDEKKEKKKTRTANFSELSWETLLEREKELAKEEKEMGHLLNRVRAQSSYIYGNNEIRQQSTKRLRAEYAHAEVKREIERRTRAMEGQQPSAPVGAGPGKGGGKKGYREREPPQQPAGPQARPALETEFQKQLLMQASSSSSSSSAAAPTAPSPNLPFDPSMLANHLGVRMPPLEQQEEQDRAKDDEPPAMQAFDPALLARRLSGLGGAPPGMSGLSSALAGFTAPSASPVAVPSSLSATPVSLANTPIQLRIPQAGQGSVLPVMPVVRPLQAAPVASASGASNVPLAFRNMMRR